MSETPGEGLTEEPQEERGPEGSRDEGSEGPDAGPADRPVGHADEDDDSGVDPQEPIDPESPDLQSGG